MHFQFPFLVSHTYQHTRGPVHSTSGVPQPGLHPLAIQDPSGDVGLPVSASSHLSCRDQADTGSLTSPEGGSSAQSGRQPGRSPSPGWALHHSRSSQPCCTCHSSVALPQRLMPPQLRLPAMSPVLWHLSVS